MEVEKGGQKQSENFPDVARQKVMNGFLDVGINAPSLFHGVDDGGEVVVGEDHICGALSHIGAGNSHGAANVGGLQSGGVIYAVPSHGHHHASLLPGLNDAHFVLGGDPSIDRETLHVLLQQLLGHEVQILTGNGQIPRAENVQIPSDGHGRQPMISSNHHWTDPCTVALDYRLPDLCPGRVDHPHQAYEGQPTLQQVGGEFPRG